MDAHCEEFGFLEDTELREIIEMNEEKNSPTEWWRGGFPETEKATRFQILYMQRRMHIVESKLTKGEKLALRLVGGFEEFFMAITKDRASEIIAQIKQEEANKKLEEVSKSILSKYGLSRNQESEISETISADACKNCGSELIKGKILVRCKKCGSLFFSLSLGGHKS